MEPILESFVLQNVVHFKKARVDMMPGLTVVLGHNKDSRISQTQNNGSGKSSLFSSIPNALFGAAPLAISRASKKDMLGEKGSRIDLNFKDFTISQLPSRWDIIIKGKDTKVRGQKQQLEKIQTVFPIREDEFYSYVYVQSQRDSVFQVSKPDARLGLITRMFNLDDYDLLRKWFVKKLGGIKESEIRFSEIETHYLNLMQREQELAWSEANDVEYKKLTKRVTKARKGIQSLMQDIGETSTLLDGAERSAKARKRFKELSKTITDYKDSEKTARAEIELNRLYSRYVREKAAYAEQHSKITEKLEAIGDTRSLKKLRKIHSKLSGKIEELQEEKRKSEILIDKRNDAVRSVKQATKLRATYPEKLIPLKKLQAELSICKTALSLKKLLDCDDNSCPTCKQSIDIANMRGEIEHAQKRSTELVIHELGHEAQTRLDKYEDTLLKIPKLALGELFYDSQIKDATKELNIVIQEGKSANNKLIYVEQLTGLKKPKKYDKPSIGAKEAEQLLHDAMEMRKIKDLVGKQTENPKDLRAKLDDLTSSKDSLESKFVRANDRWTELKMIRTELDVLTREREAAYKQLEELQPIIERKNLIKSLEKAYGKKGLKLLAVNSILGMVEQGLNAHVGLIFAEPFKFSIYADDKGVHCDVVRPDGKSSDVRLLSGAESDCFRLLFMLATRALMPAAKRPNFVILDEPDSHMDDATRELFLTTFLPYLQTIIPCVNVITPFSTRYTEADRIIRVVKQNGIATLEIK